MAYLPLGLGITGTGNKIGSAAEMINIKLKIAPPTIAIALRHLLDGMGWLLRLCGHAKNAVMMAHK